MNIWKILREAAISGTTVETTKLGTVRPIKTDSGELTGFIPYDLQKTARQHGLVIEAALWKEGRYLLHLIN